MDLGWQDGSGLVLGCLLLLAVDDAYCGAIVGHSATLAQISGQGWGLSAPKCEWPSQALFLLTANKMVGPAEMMDSSSNSGTETFVIEGWKPGPRGLCSIARTPRSCAYVFRDRP
ncbi:hypothetical protein UY3_06332 [Chelonia mydas]|uniref:Uncharacterized protein n=1 Tax=Chelonia mydas TaxID=8469 RepID=M7C7F0_CHEMY|nr:hypothetical protein UY3_06332 [Chelonia mydas]